MKKLHTFSFLAAAAIAAAVPILSATDVNAATSVAYKDFSQLDRKIGYNYSYSKLYWTEDTTIKVVHAAGNATLGDTTRPGGSKSYSYIVPGETLTLLIENSTAKNANGQNIDVLYKLSGVRQWRTDTNEENGMPRSYSTLQINRTIEGSDSDSRPASSDESTKTATLGAGDPILFWNNTQYGDGIYTLKYCKKGTYNSATDDCTADTSVTNLAAAYYDFDVPYNGSEEAYTSQTFNGDEGIVLLSGSNTIYHAKTTPVVDNMGVWTQDGGFAIDYISGAGFNGVHYSNSIFVLSTGLTNGSYSYRYTGTSCGIAAIFGSIVPYEMPKPAKSVDKTTAKSGETVTYKISQTVPLNYSTEGDIVAFMSLWSKFDNIPEKHGYSGLRITDSFDNNLEVPAASKITIVDENGNDAKSFFTLTVSGQTVTAVAKAAALDNPDFYGHTYTITVPTVVSSPITVSPIPNLAHTTYTPIGGSDTTMDSDPVDVRIFHTVCVKYVNDETDEEIADGYCRDYEHDKPYTTVESEDIPDHFALVETPGNASGIVNDDIEVEYRYYPPRTVTICWIDEETGKELVACTKEEYAQGDEYDSAPLEETPADYTLTGTPSNASGTVDGDITVVYRYRKVKNPKTIDGITASFAGISIASVLGSALFVAMKRRR